MKKVLLSLLAVAALVLSCQNYDDEFAALNSKIAGLESQITSLAELRTAVTGVQSSISALQSAVAAAQAAAEAADNSDAITALATSVAAIAADLVDLQTAIDGATTQADLDALKLELSTTLAALKALIETNSASISSLILSNTELKAALEELGVDVDSVLAANATFDGNLTITNDAELAYAKSLGNKVSTIKGNLYVKVDAFKHTSGGDGTGLTASEVNSVLSQITYVVGNVKVDTDESLDLSKLAGVTGDYIVKNYDVSDDALISVGGNVHFDYDGPYSSKIQTAGNIFLVVYDDADAAADGSAVAKVGTTSIDFMALTKATGVQTVTGTEATAHTSGASVTYGASEADKVISVSPVTTSVKIGQAKVNSVVSTGTTAATTALSTIELHYAADLGATASGLNPNGVSALDYLTISGGELTSVTVKAKQITANVNITTQFATATSNSATVDLSTVLTIGGKLTSGASVNTLTALKTVSGIDLTEQVSVSLPALTASASTVDTSNALVKDGSISLTEATSFSAPLLATIGAASTATVGQQLRANFTANKLEGTVSLPALTLAGTLSFTSATGFSAPDAVITSVALGSAATSVVVASVENPSASITPLATLTSLTLNAQRGVEVDITSQKTTDNATASINSNEFDGADALVSLTFKGYAKASTKADTDFYIAYASGKLTKLTTLVLGGSLDEVSIDPTSTGVIADAAQTALASISTSGVIRSLTIKDAFDLTSLTLGHTEDVLATSNTELVLDNNVKLSSVSTTQTMAHTIKFIDNSNLSSLNLSSLNRLPVGATSVSVWIYNNHLIPTSFTEVQTSNASTASADALVATSWKGLKGSYQAQTGGVERSYTQAGLATLANYISAIETKGTVGGTLANGNLPTLDFKLAYKYQVSTGTVGDIIIAKEELTSDGLAGGTDVYNATGAVGGTLTGPDNTIASASPLDNLGLLNELKKIK